MRSPITAARFLESPMHTRLRKFNTRDTYPEQKLDNDLCQVVVARGRTVFVRGQVGQDLDTAVNGRVGLQSRANLQGDHLSDRSALSRGCLPDYRRVAEGRVSGIDGHCRHRTG